MHRQRRARARPRGPARQDRAGLHGGCRPPGGRRLALPRLPPGRKPRRPGHPGRDARGIIETMPSKKQRRRREKLQRHEYEYVLETEDGEEIPIEKPVETDRANKASAKSAPRPTRGGREVPKPSMARVFKRTA